MQTSYFSTAIQYIYFAFIWNDLSELVCIKQKNIYLLQSSNFKCAKSKIQIKHWYLNRGMQVASNINTSECTRKEEDTPYMETRQFQWKFGTFTDVKAFTSFLFNFTSNSSDIVGWSALPSSKHTRTNAINWTKHILFSIPKHCITWLRNFL